MTACTIIAGGEQGCMCLPHCRSSGPPSLVVFITLSLDSHPPSLLSALWLAYPFRAVLCVCPFSHVPLWWLSLILNPSLPFQSTNIAKCMLVLNKGFMWHVRCPRRAPRGSTEVTWGREEWTYTPGESEGLAQSSPQQAWKSFKVLCFGLKIHVNFIFASINISIFVLLK